MGGTIDYRFNDLFGIQMDILWVQQYVNYERIIQAITYYYSIYTSSIRVPLYFQLYLNLTFMPFYCAISFSPGITISCIISQSADYAGWDDENEYLYYLNVNYFNLVPSFSLAIEWGFNPFSVFGLGVFAEQQIFSLLEEEEVRLGNITPYIYAKLRIF